MTRARRPDWGPLFVEPTHRTFGPAFDAAKDGARLSGQLEAIARYMLRTPLRQWRTLAEIEQATGYPQASISAQLRHLRKPKFGAHTVEKRRRADAGLWEYRVTARES